MHATLRSDWPEPTVSMITRSHPEASKASAIRATVIGTEPEVRRVATERTYIRSESSGSSIACIRIRSPSKAPPVRGELGSTAKMAMRRSWTRIQWDAMAFTKQDLPTPGAPVTPRIRHGASWIIAGSVIWSPRSIERAIEPGPDGSALREPPHVPCHSFPRTPSPLRIITDTHRRAIASPLGRLFDESEHGTRG